MTVTAVPDSNTRDSVAADIDLPEGWALARLSDGLVIDVQPGFACGVNSRGGDGVAHLRPMNVSRDGQIALADVKYVPASEVTGEERLLRRGDVLFNNTNSPELVGKTAWYDLPESRAFSNHMTRVRCHPDALDSRYCALILHHRWQQGYFLSVCNNHVSQASVGRSVLLDTVVPLPPLAEQQRIVEAVEALLAQVNAARQRLARVPAILKRFRQAVLGAACSGRLTEDWRTSKSQAASTEDSDDLPEGWQWSMAGRFYQDARYGTSVKCDRDAANGVPVLRIPNIASGELQLVDVKFAHVPEHELAPLILQEGDLVVCRTNGSLDLIGKTAVVPELPVPHAFASYLIRLRLDRQELTPRYLHVVISSRVGRDHIEVLARTTAGQFNLNLDILRRLPLPLPPLPEQNEIVRRVEALFALADAVERRVAAATVRAERLTQAVLAKAFRGELVPTEAELARRDGRAYEPAEALLRRISEHRLDAERAATGAAKPRLRRGAARSRTRRLL
jgi:type I restriction enzyme S subunit